jgi:hypothetical protein
MIDRYLKMTGEKPSNPYDARTLRKFEAGNLAEWVVGMVLKRAGVAYVPQKWTSFRYPNLLEVTGKSDYYAGGKPDWEKTKAEVQALGLPDFFDRATLAIIKYFSEKYPDGLKNIILEVKSCSAMMFDRYNKLGVDPRHACQAFHYLKGNDLDEAHVVYFCKDDLRIAELGVLNPSPIEDIYKDDIENITYYYTRSIEPKHEDELIFDEIAGRFSANHKVKYSNYITRLYGYADQAEFEAKYKPIVGSWNRVLNRCVRHDNMTDKNKVVIEEIQKVFPKFPEIVNSLIAKGATVDEPEEGET